MIKILAVIVSISIFSIFTSTKNNIISSKNKLNTIQQTKKIDVPENIKAIIDKSCVSCHSTNGNMAKMHVNFDYIYNGKYKTEKLIKKLNSSAKSVEKGKMPTKRYITKNPDKAMSDAEKKAFINWAKTQADKLSK